MVPVLSCSFLFICAFSRRFLSVPACSFLFIFVFSRLFPSVFVCSRFLAAFSVCFRLFALF